MWSVALALMMDLPVGKATNKVQENNGATMMKFRQLFAEWPKAIPRKGALVTEFGETIPFSDFLINDNLLLLSRTTPDASGTQRVIIDSAAIVSVKFLEAIELPRFLSMGFQKPEQAVVSSLS